MITDKNAPRTSTRSAQAPSAKATATAAPPKAARPLARADNSQTVSQTVSQARGGAVKDAGGPNQAALKAQGDKAAQNRGTILTKPSDIIRHELGAVPGAKEKYMALSCDDKAAFDKLMTSQVVEGTKINTESPKMGGMGGGIAGMMGASQANAKPPSPEEQKKMAAQNQGTGARRGLVALLGQGKLTQKDGDCNTLLSNLESIRNQKTAQGLDGESVMRGVIRDTSFAPAPKGNVAVAEYNKSLASNKPAEYARVIAGLASPEGQVQLGDKTLQAAPGTTNTAKTKSPFGHGMGQGPSASSQLFQGSVDPKTARNELFRMEVTGDAKAEQKYARLSPSEQAKFKQLYDGTIPKGDHPTYPQSSDPSKPVSQEASRAHFDKVKSLQTSVQARQGLTNLLSEGKLKEKDSRGQSLVDNLASISQQKMASEGGHTLDNKAVLNEVISQIDDPGLIRQNNKGTCTVTTVEHLLASRQPAEYARVMGDLTGTSGSVRLQDGTTVPREKGMIAPDDSNRTNTSRIFQATMMEYGNGAAEDYRNKEDGHFNAATGEKLLNNKDELKGGLSMEGWKSVSDSALGTTSELRVGTLRSGSRSQIGQDMQTAIDSNKTVQVNLRWSKDEDGKHGYHALSVTGQDDKYVYLRNPHGSGDSGNTDPSRALVREALKPSGPQASGAFGGGFGGLPDTRTEADPRLSTGESGSIRVTKEEFYKNLDSYLVQDPPKQEAKSTSWFDSFNPFG